MGSMEGEQQKRLLRAREVAEITGWSLAKVYSMALSGDLPSLRAGRSVRYPLTALERWIEANTTGGDTK
jgi:excisionase family DNA binding protein